MTSDFGDVPGYTDESLRMLETAEGQVNAVFACFGSAAQHAQMFEQALAKFLSAYNKVSAGSLTLEDFEAYKATLQKKTMGWLLRESSKYVSFDDEDIAKRLDKALERRNFLMHEFFLLRDSEFKSEEGRSRLLAELVSIAELLDQARITVNAMRIAMCRTLGVPDTEAAS